MFKLEPYSTYVIEIDVILSETAKSRLRERLHYQTAHLKCRFIILDGGLKIVREVPKEEEVDEEAIEIIDQDLVLNVGYYSVDTELELPDGSLLRLAVSGDDIIFKDYADGNDVARIIMNKLWDAGVRPSD